MNIVGACSATGNGSNVMKAPVCFGTYEEAEAYFAQIASSQDKRQCGNGWYSNRFFGLTDEGDYGKVDTE